MENNDINRIWSQHTTDKTQPWWLTSLDLSSFLGVRGDDSESFVTETEKHAVLYSPCCNTWIFQVFRWCSVSSGWHGERAESLSFSGANCSRKDQTCIPLLTSYFWELIQLVGSFAHLDSFWWVKCYHNLKKTTTMKNWKIVKKNLIFL